jgi:hypothetical protein
MFYFSIQLEMSSSQLLLTHSIMNQRIVSSNHQPEASIFLGENPSSFAAKIPMPPFYTGVGQPPTRLDPNIPIEIQ